MLVVLNTFLKKIINTNPIENSTLAKDIISNARAYKWRSSTWIPISKEYIYNIIHISSLVINSLIK